MQTINECTEQVFSLVPISFYDSITSVQSRVILLDDFLRLGGMSQYREIIDKVRATSDKDERRRLKAMLPCATIAGTFHPQRKNEMLTQPSGLLCIDIDADENPTVYDWDDLKRVCADIFKSVCYASLSVSGRGIFCIHNVGVSTNYAEAYGCISADYLSKLGIVTDRQCKNVSRVRYLSFDENPVWNFYAEEYQCKPQQPSFPAHETFNSYALDNLSQKTYKVGRGGQMDVEEALSVCCHEIEQRRVDITTSYDDWFRVGMSLASLGERGRSYFHAVSRQYPKYSPRETDKKFDELLRSKSGNVGIATFFHICEQNNIRYGEIIKRMRIKC
jgi:hypothetical protein